MKLKLRPRSQSPKPKGKIKSMYSAIKEMADYEDDPYGYMSYDNADDSSAFQGAPAISSIVSPPQKPKTKIKKNLLNIIHKNFEENTAHIHLLNR